MSSPKVSTVSFHLTCSSARPYVSYSALSNLSPVNFFSPIKRSCSFLDSENCFSSASTLSTTFLSSFYLCESSWFAFYNWISMSATLVFFLLISLFTSVKLATASTHWQMAWADSLFFFTSAGVNSGVP